MLCFMRYVELCVINLLIYAYTSVILFLLKCIIIINWHWHAKSNLTLNSKLTPFWASNFNHKCSLAPLRSLLIRGLIDLELHFHFQLQNLFIFIVAVGIETVKLSLVCFCDVQGLVHSLHTNAHILHCCSAWFELNKIVHLDCFRVWLFHNTILLCHVQIYPAEGISAFNAALVFYLDIHVFGMHTARGHQREGHPPICLWYFPKEYLRRLHININEWYILFSWFWCVRWGEVFIHWYK